MTTYLKDPNRWVVAAAAVIMQAGLGSFYGWSVFREPLSSLYGANVTYVNVTFFIATFMVGFAAFGGGYGTMPALVDAYYGSRDVGAIYGSIITASGVAGFGAPLLLAWLVDTTGSYSPALYVTAGAMLVGAVIALATRPPGFPRCAKVGAAPDSRRVR